MAINKTPIASPKYKGYGSDYFKPRTKGVLEISLSISDNTLYISHDLGVTWFKAENIHDPDTCYMGQFEGYIGVRNKARDTFYISVDDGITFNRFPLPKNIDINWGVSCSVSFSHPKSLIIKGYFPTLKQWLICYTNDSAKTWNFSMSWDYCNFVEGDQFVDDLVHCGVKKRITKSFQPSQMYYTTELFSEGSIKPIDFDPRNGHIDRNRNGGYEVGDVWYQHKYNTDELFVSFDGIDVKKFEFPPELWPRGVTYSVREFTDEFFGSMGNILFYLDPHLTEETKAYVNPFYKLVVLDKNSNQLKLMLDNIPFTDECIFKCIDLNNGTLVANIVPDLEVNRYLRAKRSPDNYGNVKCQTVISHDCGEHWSPLIGPNGAELSLALRKHYDYDAFNEVPIPSYGTFIAYGNEGAPLRIDEIDPDEFLTPKDETMNAYITRDSGYTWSVLSTKPMLYVIGNRGKIIFEQSHSETKVDALVYSVDSGVTWHRHELGFWAYVSIGNGYTYTSNNFSIYITKEDERYCFTLSFVDEVIPVQNIAS